MEGDLGLIHGAPLYFRRTDAAALVPQQFIPVRIPENQFYLNMKNTGNTVSSTIPIALEDSILSNRIQAGDKVLIAGFGVGYSYGATVLTIS